MKKSLQIVFIYLIGVIFLVTLAIRVRAIDSSSISNTSIAGNYTIDLSNYE